MVLKYSFVLLTLAYILKGTVSQFRPLRNRGLGRPPMASSGLLRPSMTNPRMSPVVQSGLFGGFGSFLLDSDTLQEKPCGGRAGRPAANSIRLWSLQSLFEPNFVCKCKIFTDGFDIGRIDNSPQARMDCMTAISGHYCCLRT